MQSGNGVFAPRFRLCRTCDIYRVPNFKMCGNALAAAAILLLLGGPALGQFYHPDKRIYATPNQYGLKYEPVKFKSADGTLLSGWFVPATRTAAGTVVHYHGNAQNMTSHFNFVAWLPKEGFNVFVFDYRGYGQSQGSPARDGIHEDSVAALQYIKTRRDIAQDRILVLGQSLGGANAIDAVASAGVDNIRGVAIDSAFFSYKSIAKDKAPDFLVDLAISDAHSPGPLIARLAPIPLVIMHGTADQVVPYAHGQKLFAAAGQPKQFWTVQNGAHLAALSVYGTTYRPKLLQFFRNCLEQTAAAEGQTAPTSGGRLPAQQ